MTDQIYIIDPTTKKPIEQQPVSLSEIGIRERLDLQPWIIDNPEMLGEPFLIITSEYDRFEKSNLRLDLLALDKYGVLSVIELKLDASRTLADLQAIRYAAFCSNMTIEDVVEEYCTFHDCNQETAEQRICEFLSLDALPDLDTQPRIVLAAGVIVDQELTSCVLWLRKCGVDISCVELTPYRNQKTNEIIIVPKVLIPLPETKEYIIGVERKEARKVQKSRENTELEIIGQAIADEFIKLDTGFEVSRGRMRNGYMTVRLRHPWIHYEWLYRRRSGTLEVALHFEGSDRAENLRLMESVDQHRADIIKDIPWEYSANPWGNKRADVKFSISLEDGLLTSKVAPEAAKTMAIFIKRTWPFIESYVRGNE